MPLEIMTVPCLSDNYAYLLHNSDSGQTALVDAPEAPPILAALKSRGWTLTDILITHHHWDHIDGVEQLKDETNARVIGAAADAHRLPPLDVAVSEGDSVEICGESADIIDVSGHTVGHIAFHFPNSNAVFTADSLMALGCGRLFEGTPEMMWESLSKLAALPAETVVYSGHEYTVSNAKFAQTIEPDNSGLILRIEAVTKARDAGKPTVPSLLSEELATNPFLRAALPEVKKAVGMDQASDTDVFAEIRRRKDNF
ncbi:hydroxyacylglutathione hydrolase [Actibacterium lipolyticum]|uniref:Hydroxyacylglutathione hydrolase n=1 Tax=Actibacterium lipolyticum TaxID=1524263 RepID=A0A238JMB8_9RHOB|nr:hydroxyacylglutathione hydrolase [Actibacterium lipolyticum]SMX31635.1 Hydroxyacylglutathione hydrolase [Actibacterium lipolyticum]